MQSRLRHSGNVSKTLGANNPFSWGAYWASRYSSGLVLTVNSNTQITLDWTNNGDTDYDGVSIERSTDGVTYAEIDTGTAGDVQYVDAGLTEDYYWYRIRYYRGSHYSAYSGVVYNAAPLVVYDGNTVGWYDYNDLTTITKDGANRVSVWADKLGSGHDLLQVNGADQPLWSLANGVLFDGVSEYMKAAFAYIQPEFIYFVGRQVTWTINDYIFDGNTIIKGVLTQAVATPQIRTYAGTNSALDANLAVNTFGIVRVLFNGLNSSLQVNENAAWNGNSGASDMNGFTLGASGNNLAFSNIEVKEIPLRRTADNAATQTIIYDYLEIANGL